MTRNERREKGRIRIGNHSFEEVQEFKYLGSTITENNKTSKEIKARIAAGNRSYYALKIIFQSRNASKNAKKKIYTTVIRPIVTYTSETLSLIHI